jgi:DNA-directed RNA polymerase subunit RPC12/RpoP
MAIEDGLNEMRTGSDETATKDEDADQRRCKEAGTVTSFDNSGNEMGNSSKISSGSAGRFECHCGKIFWHKTNLYTHKKTHDTKFEPSLRCTDCGNKFSGKRELNRHIKSIHQGYFYECPICGKRQSNITNSYRHIRKEHARLNAKPIEKCEK